MKALRRAHIYTFESDLLGIKGTTQLVVHRRGYMDDSHRALVCTPLYPVYISRQETAEFLWNARKRIHGAVPSLTVTYTRTTDPMF